MSPPSTWSLNRLLPISEMGLLSLLADSGDNATRRLRIDEAGDDDDDDEGDVNDKAGPINMMTPSI